jgi:hypothetical protein
MITDSFGTFELRDCRRQLEHAVGYYDKNHPGAPILANLRKKLDDVLTEQDERARIADA